MFIQCSDCDYKYIVNSADLKPDGRMVECANCNHRWFQEPLKGEDLLSSSVPKTSQEKPLEKEEESQNRRRNQLSNILCQLYQPTLSANFISQRTEPTSFRTRSVQRLVYHSEFRRMS